jgi:hypothetical protein
MVGVGMAALSAALKARVGCVTALDVEDLRARAEAELPPGDPLRRAVTQFAVQFDRHRRNRVALAEAGEQMQRFLTWHVALPRPPIGADRADIHG